MELCIPLHIQATHNTLQTAMCGASLVYGVFYVGFSTKIAWFMIWVSVLTICSRLYLLYYCLELYCATLLYSIPARQLVEQVLLLYVDAMAVVHYV